MRVKGEELVSLLAGAADWYNKLTQDALDGKYLIWPQELARVDALVLAYFPDQRALWRLFKKSCLDMHSVITEIYRDKTTNPEYGSTLGAFFTAATALQDAVLLGMQSEAK
jgi:hypothetical protein